MAGEWFPSLRRVTGRMKKHPQLFWTIFVAIAITAGFIVVAQLFISIAQDAQERLVNVRIGSIQDSLSEFVVLEPESKDRVDTAINNLMAQNPTILDFTFYERDADAFKVFASSETSREGSVTRDIPLAGQLALNDPKNSYTIEIQNPDERLYQTFRALSQDGQVVGLVATTQTLSQADLIVEENIRTGIAVFMVILLLVMYLFFRHSRIIDYATLYEDLKQVDTLKDDFLSMASHELKTPLAAIRGYSEFITDAAEVSEDLKEYSRRIDVSSRQLALLVEDMLDVSRIQQGRMQMEISKILVPDFVQKLMPDFNTLAKEKNLTCTLEHAGLKHAHIMSDETRLRQVLINLVGNAIKYTKQGSVKIGLSNVGEQLEIRISDTGIGMDETERKRLFEKFYRVRNTETQEIKGTGLGLWITKELIERMGGKISIESIKGVGTHVIVRFKGIA